MAVTRRDFLAGAASGGLAFGRSGYHPLLACQMFVWTQQFTAQKKTLEQGMEEAFPAIRRAGFRRLELSSQFFAPETREATAQLLKANHLEVAIAYTGGVMHEAARVDKTIRDALEVAATARTMGAKALNVNPNPTREPKTEEQLLTQVRTLNLLARELSLRGMQLFLHQHAPEMKDNARDWRFELTHTDPQQVLIGLDVEWVLRGGQDPMTLLREAGDRIASLHLRNDRKGVWMELFDKGDIDYDQVAAYLKELKYSGYLVVELAYEKGTEITRPLEEDLRLSRVFAEKTFGIRA